jgi:alkanesulfonate monooxygenase SsuD/methylene tetrahydromethanopterin reductase-like flavin-dependent oxidoreductase (luciferase family)
VPIHRLAYAALVYAAPNEADARAGAEKLLWYITSNKVPPHIANPPGYVSVPANVAMLRGAEHPLSAFRNAATVDGAIDAGIMFAGTPDQVYRQMKRLYNHVGGFGHLLIMGQAGFLEHDETVQGIRCFAREVYPRVREEFPDTAISGVG